MVLEDLIAAHFDGTLDETQEKTLGAQLQGSSEARELMASYMRLEGAILSLGKAGFIAPRAAAAAPRRTILLGAAAAAVVVLSVAAYFMFGGQPPAVAHLERADGDVRANGTRAAVGQGLVAGEALQTYGTRSRAVLRFPDGTLCRLEGDTALKPTETKWELIRGTLAADVRPRVPGAPVVIATPHGEATVLGTTLRIVVNSGGTRLEVGEGKVRLTRLSDRKTVDVQGGHFAVAAQGVDLVARSAAGSALIATMKPNQWLAVPSSHLRRVVPDPARYPKIQGDAGAPSIINCWSGGAFDTRRNRMVIWGGGSDDYRGNEIYAFGVESLTWERLTDPTPDPADGKQVNADGTPNIRATYNGLAYLAHVDRFFALGGDIGSSARGTGERPDKIWLFDFSRLRWTSPSPSGTRPPTGYNNVCAYDPESRKVWWGEPLRGLYSYDIDQNVWTRHNTEDSINYQTAAVDTRRGLLVLVGRGKVYSYDLRRGRFDREVWKTTGGDAFIAHGNAGLDYDPVADRLVGWAGGAVYALDPETKVWRAYDAPGAPSPSMNGIFGRWRYVPAFGVFVAVTGVDEDVRLFKFSP